MKTLPKYQEFLFERKWEKEIKSSHLIDIIYDDVTEVLEIGFNNGSRYQYEGVPKHVFRDFADEPNMANKAGNIIKKGLSKLTKKEIDEGTYGTRFWELIRKGNYKYTKIN